MSSERSNYIIERKKSFFDQGSKIINKNTCPECGKPEAGIFVCNCSKACKSYQCENKHIWHYERSFFRTKKQLGMNPH